MGHGTDLVGVDLRTQMIWIPRCGRSLSSRAEQLSNSVYREH